MVLRHRQNDTVSAAISHRILSPILPEELIREILARLPVKFLVQLKCVCKLWKALISDSQFAKNHLQFSIADPRMTNRQLVFSVLENPYKTVSYPLESLFENPSTPVEPVTFSFMKNQKCIIGSCNGMLGLFHSSKNTVIMWNPSIRFKSNKSPEAVSLDWMIMQYGFGYDQVHDKYKALVVAQKKDDSSQFFTKIYTFSEDSWKTIPNFSIMPTTRLGKFASGTLNWMVYTGVHYNPMIIFSFDLEKETYREVLLPQDDGINVFTRPVLYVLSNCLCVCESSGVVWLMKEYGVVESWTKLMIIPQQHIHNKLSFVDPLFISENSVLFMRTSYSQICIYNSNNGRNRTSFAEPLCILENGDVILAKNPSSQLVLYDSNSGQLNPLITSTLGFNLHVYCESLVSPQC